LTINVANEELLAEIAQAEMDVDIAVNAATEAFKSWRLVPAPSVVNCL
jgi:acyl-CoA reductase-like NAD-dependent aldehyde dehydrogenase